MIMSLCMASGEVCAVSMPSEGAVVDTNRLSAACVDEGARVDAIDHRATRSVFVCWGLCGCRRVARVELRVRVRVCVSWGGVYWPAIARSRQEHSAVCRVITPRTLEFMRLSACCVRGARVSWDRARRPSVGVCSGVCMLRRVCIVSALL